MTAHHKLGASGAHRWMRCTKAPSMETGLPDTSSKYAIEGSLAHYLLEICLLDDKDPEEFLGMTNDEFPGFEVDEDMAEYIEGVIGRAKLRCGTKGILWPEQQVDYGPWAVEGAFGTSDIITYLPDEKTLVITDLKYGSGLKVYADDNEQLMLYALGSYNMLECLYDIEHIEMIIDQPRLKHYSEWTITLEELLEFGKLSRKKALETENDPQFGPSEKACHWCKFSGNCKALAEYMSDVIAADFDVLSDDEVEVSDPEKLSMKEVSNVLKHKSMVEKWLTALKQKAIDEIKGGGEVPGFKLVTGRSNRRWDSESDAETALRRRLKVSEIFTKKLISPTQAEKALGKKRIQILEGLIVKPQGSPTLAEEDDKRRALSFDVSEDFEDLSADDDFEYTDDE